MRQDLADFEARKQGQPGKKWPMGGRKIAALIALVVIVIILVPVAIIGFHVADDYNAMGTVTSFCTAVSAEDYNTAYNLLSQRVRNEMTLDGMRSALQGAKLAGCTNAEDLTHRRDQTLGNQIQVDMTYAITDADPISGTMALHRDSDGWRVDGLQANAGSFPLFGTSSASGRIMALAGRT